MCTLWYGSLLFLSSVRLSGLPDASELQARISISLIAVAVPIMNTLYSIDIGIISFLFLSSVHRCVVF